MFESTPSNFHVEYMSVTQHWCSTSEKYAGGDALVTALANGWKMEPVVYVEEKAFTGSRFTTIYHIDLKRDDASMHMPVIDNPYVGKLVAQLQVLPMNSDSGEK